MSDWENSAASLIKELGLMVAVAGNFATEPDKRPMSDEAIIRSLRESQAYANEILAYMTKSVVKRGEHRKENDK